MSKEAMKLDDKAVAQILSRLPSPPVGDGSALHAWAMQVVRKLAEQSVPVQPDETLLSFYQATDFPSLVSAMNGHIKKMQSKLQSNPHTAIDAWNNREMVAVEHCIWARNGNTPCPHTSPQPAQQEPLFKPLIDLHPGLAEELKAMDFPQSNNLHTGWLVRGPKGNLDLLTDSQIMASVGRHWGGEKTSISQSRPVGQQWEQICELVRCVIRERFNTPPAQQEPVARLLLDSKQNFERNFGQHWQADWIYSDLAELIDSPPPEQPATTKCWKCGDADPAFTDVCQVPACGMREQP